MKILFLSSWYPTKQNPNFGIFVKEHARAIKTAGNEIIVMALVINRSNKLFSKNISDNYDENGIRTIIIEINSKYKDIIYHLIPFQYLILKSVLKKLVLPSFNPDIIHSNVVFPAGIIGNCIAKYTKKPHIITEHWSRIAGFISKPILGNMAIKAYKRADMILPVSSFLKQNIVKLIPNLENSNLKVVGNIIDSETFFFNEKNNTSNTITFCAIATWANKKIPDKIPELFIEALAQLQKDIDQKIILKMIGGGDKISELSALCSSKSLNAEFIGFQQKHQIAKHLQASDFFLHASFTETFGVVIAEALLTGTPVICSNVGALPELINDSNGILVENDIENWVSGIKRALNTDYHPNEIAQQVKNNFSYETIGEKINNAYSTVLASHKKSMK